MHPEEGTWLDEISELGVDGQAGDPQVVRERTTIYALKFIGRITGSRPGR
jgi:hypothetical protein